MSDFVRLDPHVIDEIVAICNTTLTELHQALKTTDRLQLAEGFGDFESAQQLAAGYARKGAGTPESARERVEQFIEALTQLRDAFASGGEAFLDAQFDWTRQLQNIDIDA
ncbi:hypothetical protein ACFWB0_17925 [Rhodococcus sp. NPDC060086]|uniref:hypothetical protein n=1 Tax=Rhodococcus sp. NPDC060086 TaxID=3347055 RepID=UPI00365FF85E